MVKIVARAQSVKTPEPVDVRMKIVGAARLTMSMTAPVLRPNSGRKLLVMTRNSWTESGFRAVKPGWGSVKPGISASLLSVPSSRKLLLRSREPIHR
jgi:hypothetical protein